MTESKFRRRVASLFTQYPRFATFAHDVYRLTQPRFSVGVVGVVMNEQKQVLLVEHVFHALPWGFPGGWINRGEDPAECARREIQEELGLTVEVESLLLSRLSSPRIRHIDFAYLCRLVSPLEQLHLSGELLAHGWYDLDEVPRLVDFQRQVITLLREQRVREEQSL